MGCTYSPKTCSLESTNAYVSVGLGEEVHSHGITKPERSPPSTCLLPSSHEALGPFGLFI